MLDYKFIVENEASVKLNVANRAVSADVDAVVRLYAERTALDTGLQALRQKRNENAASMKGRAAAALEPGQRGALVEEGRRLKDEIAAAEAELSAVERELEARAREIPNMAHPDAPIGGGDADNVEVKRVGEPPAFDFAPADHARLALDLDIVDFDAATKVSGTKFYYLKNEGVFLELGLVRYALDVLTAKGFTPFVTPDVARTEILEGIGFNPRGDESNVYALEGEASCLVGTAEITLGGFHAGEILGKERLPLRMAGLSHCFRREAGAAGQFSKGLYRVHQFTKLEMFVVCLPEDSERMHLWLREIEEEIFAGLEIPFRVVDTCVGDLGAPAFRKWDLEAWMPGRADGGGWGEVTSTSNCADFQARRLNVRYKDDDGKNRFVHMLNGTAIAVPRAIIALLENHQRADGSVRIPPALRPYVGFDEIAKK